MTTRELKALEIAARMRLMFVEGTWIVPSQTSATPYRVKFTENGATCTCEDWELRQEDCKHIIAARLVAEREGRGDRAPTIDIETLPPKKQDKRDWAIYRHVRYTEKARFLPLLHQLCNTIPEPPYVRGRPPTPLADVAFACVFKVYSKFSTDRFASDLSDAVDKGYMSRPMHPNKVNTHLEEASLTPILRKLIENSSLPFQALESVFAPDGTGFSVSRYRRWFSEKDGKHRKKHDWVKAHVMIGVNTHVVTAVEISDGDGHDNPYFKPLLEATAKNFQIKDVVADKGYLDEKNFELVEAVKGRAFIPFKGVNIPHDDDSAWDRAYHMFHLNRQEYLKHYHQRSNVESLFSSSKEKFQSHVHSRTDDAMKNEVLCKFICHNICAFHQAQIELGLESEFWPKEQADEPCILKLMQPS